MAISRVKHIYFCGIFSNERIAGEQPELEVRARGQYQALLNSLSASNHPIQYSNARTDSAQTPVKIFFEVTDESLPPYVIRQVMTTTPLKQALQNYIQGVTSSEYNKGYHNNTLGIDAIKSVTISNHTTNIHFTANDLQIQNPMQVMNFTDNISRITEQFSTVNSVNICINNISNYQTTFFSNEPIIPCDF